MTQPHTDSSSVYNRLEDLADEFVQRYQRGERPALMVPYRLEGDRVAGPPLAGEHRMH